MPIPLTDIEKSLIEEAFPNLASDGWQPTSFKDPKYNCAAWANGENHRKWSAMQYLQPGYYWPRGAIVGNNLDAAASAYKIYGFVECENGAFEEGIEKIALYEDDAGKWGHVARQLSNGKWTSKLGNVEDIEHSTPRGVECSLYGAAKRFMKRNRSTL